MGLNSQQIHSASERLSVPAAGRTVQGMLLPWAQPVYRAFVDLRDRTPEELRPMIVERYRRIYSSPAVLDTGSVLHDEFELACSAALSVYLVGSLSSPTGAPFSFVQAEQWFLGKAFQAVPSFSSLGWPDASALGGLEVIRYDSRLLDLLPYVLEVFVTGPVGSSRAADESQRNNRSRKRERGSFYTPSDVAEYIVRSSLRTWEGNTCAEHRSNPAILDPACGTGVFLVAALKELLAMKADNIGAADRLDLVCRCLSGIDIDIQATQAAAFVLLAHCTHADDTNGKFSPWNAWTAIRSKLATLDSTQLVEPQRGKWLFQGASDVASGNQQLSLGLEKVHSRMHPLQRIFPGSAGAVDLVVGNPPYSTIFRSRTGASRRLAYLPFVRMMWELVRPTCAASGMVVPLSVTYHTGKEVVALRAAMGQAPGRWRVASFDRTPDSLFGDDVKTRAAILLFDTTGQIESRLETTELIRWNSRARDQLFGKIRFSPATWSGTARLIPKLGSDTEARAYHLLHEAKSRNYSRLRVTRWKPDQRYGGSTVFFGSTAYNWLPVYREITEELAEAISQRGADHLSCIECGSPSNADLIFAVASSRLVYWLWRVKGDGFHLPQRFFRHLPLTPERFSASTQSRLAQLGFCLWKEIWKTPTRSINKGRVSISYSPLACDELLDMIDMEISSDLNLPAQLPEYMRELRGDTVVAGRHL